MKLSPDFCAAARAQPLHDAAATAAPPPRRRCLDLPSYATDSVRYPPSFSRPICSTLLHITVASKLLCTRTLYATLFPQVSSFCCQACTKCNASICALQLVLQSNLKSTQRSTLSLLLLYNSLPARHTRWAHGAFQNQRTLPRSAQGEENTLIESENMFARPAL